MIVLLYFRIENASSFFIVSAEERKNGNWKLNLNIFYPSVQVTSSHSKVFFQGFLFRICWIFMNFSFPLPHFAHFYLVLWNKSSTFHPSVVHNTSSKATFHSPLSHSTLLFLHIILKRFLSRTKDNLLRWYEREKCFLHPTHFYSFWSTTITRMCKYEEVRSVVEKYWIQKQKRAALLGRIFYPFFSLLNQDPNWDREA